MVMAMILAHLVGDFILQWDALALWKSTQLRGVLVHSAIVFAVTWLFIQPFDPGWWQGVVFISLTHVAIDAASLLRPPPFSPLVRFTVDQVLHFLMIFLALIAGGFLSWGSVGSDFVAAALATPRLTAVTAYAFITMPAWVVLKFAVYAAVKHAPPDFPAKPSKYVGIAERLLIATFVALGQIFLVPLVTLPRVVSAWPQLRNHQLDAVYLTEFAASATLAVGTGIFLRLLLT